MEMLRNREFRQFAIIFFLIAAASVTLGFANNMAAGILALFSSFAFGTAFFVFTKARYKSLMQISEQIDLVRRNQADIAARRAADAAAAAQGQTSSDYYYGR